MTEEQMAINRLMCGNTAHSCKADYIKLAIKALEKQVPKKPKLVTRAGGLIKFYPCPNCSTTEKYIPVYPSEIHCCFCGQRLDWSE